jgi:hypothetical protein
LIFFLAVGAAGKEALERFEATAEIAQEREQFARQAALVVAVMAALLALSTLASNNQMERSIISQELATAKLLQASWADTTPAEKAKLQADSRKLEATRHDAEAKHRLYQFAEASFQLAIVLASVAILTRLLWLLVVSGAAGVVGLLFFVNGWFLLITEPLVHVID